jgi:hypothetical protein
VDTPQVKHPERAEHRFPREAVGAVRGHLVTPYQEVADPVVDVVVDRPVRRQAGAMPKYADQPRNRRLSRSRTSGQALVLPGTSRSLTFALSRSTLFFDGLAPRYQWPSFR